MRPRRPLHISAPPHYSQPAPSAPLLLLLALTLLAVTAALPAAHGYQGFDCGQGDGELRLLAARHCRPDLQLDCLSTMLLGVRSCELRVWPHAHSKQQQPRADVPAKESGPLGLEQRRARRLLAAPAPLTLASTLMSAACTGTRLVANVTDINIAHGHLHGLITLSGASLAFPAHVQFSRPDEALYIRFGTCVLEYEAVQANHSISPLFPDDAGGHGKGGWDDPRLVHHALLLGLMLLPALVLVLGLAGMMMISHVRGPSLSAGRTGSASGGGSRAWRLHAGTRAGASERQMLASLRQQRAQLEALLPAAAAASAAAGRAAERKHKASKGKGHRHGHRHRAGSSASSGGGAAAALALHGSGLGQLHRLRRRAAAPRRPLYVGPTRYCRLACSQYAAGTIICAGTASSANPLVAPMFRFPPVFAACDYKRPCQLPAVQLMQLAPIPAQSKHPTPGTPRWWFVSAPVRAAAAGGWLGRAS